MVWCIGIVFLIITIVLLSGKGSFLIAGYNTSSKANKMKFDEKKLCRVMGSGMGIITVFMIVLAYLGDNPPNWIFIALPLVIIAVSITMLILGNTICKVNNHAVAEETNDEDKRNARIIKASLVFTAAIFMMVGIVLFTGKIEITIDDNNMVIDGSYWADYNVTLSSIDSISNAETLDVGRRTNGLGSFKLLEGHFKNNEFGDYILYVYLKCDSYIVLDTSDGIVVINAVTPQETESLYKVLESAVSQRQ